MVGWASGTTLDALRLYPIGTGAPNSEEATYVVFALVNTYFLLVR